MLAGQYAIYYLHWAYWGSFGITLLILRGRGSAITAAAPATTGETTAPYSRALLAFHMVAFALMYFGLGNAVIPNRVPAWFHGQRATGTLVIAAGAALNCWALVYFQSWRLRAKLEAHHQLATGGPFQFLRHPIYMGLNLLALGSAIWVPTVMMWIAAVVTFIGSDLRGRAEEKLLEQAFGSVYRDYCARTQRFVPGIY